ncbi:MAG: putative toxin-antitoxin system toxin component, PIN family [Rhodospirillales bacterium]|nr:putative toxin-antitoxin system toxin component, PIN family [Rhodospirillales bacterium]
MVGAALRRDGIPRRALLKARREDILALSPAVEREIRDVLARPKFARYLTAADRDEILALLTQAAIRIEPNLTVRDCRDAKDDKYLELAAAARADAIVSSDGDLLVLDPWRGIPILTPAAYLGARSARLGRPAAHPG